MEIEKKIEPSVSFPAAKTAECTVPIGYKVYDFGPKNIDLKSGGEFTLKLG